MTCGRGAIACLVLAGCFASPATPSQPPTAEAIVAAAIAAYSTTASYEDHGEAVTTFDTHSNDPIGDDHRTFTTAFVRGGRFRFEVVVRDTPYTVWSDGTHSYSRWRHGIEPGVHMEANTIDALRDASGVSTGLSTRIPSLLLRGATGGAWLSALQLRVDGTEVIDGAPCWRLTGVARNGTVAVWIDRGSHGIRRIVERRHSKERDEVTTITFTPVLGMPIDPEHLATPLPDGPESSWIGVVFEPDTTRIAHVIEDGPARRAKLAIGDAITAVDGDPFSDRTELLARIAQSPPGARLVLTVAHGADKRSVIVLTQKRPYLEQLARERILDKPAPDFALRVISGPSPASRRELASHVVVLAFGSSSCQSCLAAFAKLSAWHAKYAARRLDIVFVSGERDADIDRLARATNIAFTAAADDDDRAVMAFLGAELPMLVVIDKRGIVRRIDSYAETADIELTLDELLR